MITPIANKYAYALINNSNDELSTIANALREISLAFKSTKMKYIILSTPSDKVVDFLSSLSNFKNEKVNKFLKILSLKNKLTILPQVSEVVDIELSKKENKYTGYIYCKDSLDDLQISTLEDSLSKKIGKNISLTVKDSNFDGIKVDIPMLCMELSYSKEKLQQQLINSIINSI